MKIVLEQSKSPMILADEDLPIFAQLVAIADMGMCDEVFQGEAKTIHKIKCMFVGYQKGDDGKLAQVVVGEKDAMLPSILRVKITDYLIELRILYEYTNYEKRCTI